MIVWNISLVGVIRASIPRFIRKAMPKRVSHIVNHWIHDNYTPDRYNTESLSFRKVNDKLAEHGVTIRTPYPKKEKTVKIAKENRVEIGTADLKHHRFGDYYFQLAEFLNSEKSAAIGKDIRREYWENYDPLNKKDKLRDLGLVVGWHDVIKPGGSIVSEKQCGETLYKLNFSGRFGLNYCVFHGKPKGIDEPEGIVIALHGSLSGPDYVMGLDGKADYSREFGAYWVNKGYDVYAPQLNWSIGAGFPLVNCNYSALGDDLAKIEDLLHFIVETRKYSGDKTVPIVVSGISYGGKLALLSGTLFDDIDTVILIASVSEDWFDRFSPSSQWLKTKLSKLTVDPTKPTRRDNTFNQTYKIFFSGLGLYQLLAPKPFIISSGLHDLPDEKFKMIFEIVDYYKSIGYGDDVKLNIFDGGHESDPNGEFNAYLKLKSPQNKG